MRSSVPATASWIPVFTGMTDSYPVIPDLIGKLSFQIYTGFFFSIRRSASPTQ